MLPAGPAWKCKPWKTTNPTKSPVKLFYRDPIECIESLLNSPLSADNIEFSPYQVYRTAEKAVRVYSEWMSGNVAWSMQVCSIPYYSLIASHSSQFLGKDTTRGNTLGDCSIFRQNNYICNDRGSNGPPSSHQPC